MNKRLLHYYTSLENDRQKLLKELSGVPDQRFNTNPLPGKWSIGQILTHIITSERLTLLYMRKKSLGIDLVDNSGWIESFKMLFLEISQRLPFLKFKAPGVVVEHTPEALSYAEVVHQWDRVREQLKKFLEEIDEKNVRKKIYKHPVVGRLDASQAIRFCGEHIRHHLPQIRKLMK